MGNKKRNLLSIGKGLLFVGSIVLRAINIIFLPITMIAGGIISFKSIEIDSKKMIKIFEEAFTPLKFKSLHCYIINVKNAINNLDSLGKTLKKKEEKNK